MKTGNAIPEFLLTRSIPSSIEPLCLEYDQEGSSLKRSLFSRSALVVVGTTERHGMTAKDTTPMGISSMLFAKIEFEAVPKGIEATAVCRSDHQRRQDEPSRLMLSYVKHIIFWLRSQIGKEAGSNAQGAATQ